MKRIFEIEVQTNAGTYWSTYDGDISSLAEGKDRVQWLTTDQPGRTWRLIEVLSHEG